ncbi:MAG: energy transducer TonB [Acidobacteriia bacterium]|nr:energy transducer TonB [Terriglobia bacterium]
MHPAKEENAQVPPTPQNLLDRCLFDGDAAAISSGRRRRRKALGISFAIETVALALLIVIPILTSVAQPKLSQQTPGVYLFGARHPHVVEVRPHAPSTSPMNHNNDIVRYDVGQVASPRKPVTESAEGDPGLNGASSDAEQPDPGAPTIGSIQLPNLPQPTIIRKPEENRPVKLSEGVVQAQLISRIEPRYPSLAQQIKLQGAVVLHAIISRDGSITSLDVLSGHPLLVKVALDAVRQWRYRPTLLNGEPVEVETTITVIFRLQQ